MDFFKINDGWKYCETDSCMGGKRSIFGKKKVAVCNDAAKLKVGHDDFRVALYHLDRTLRAHVHVGLPPHTVHNGRKSSKHIWSYRCLTKQEGSNFCWDFDRVIVFLNYCLTAFTDSFILSATLFLEGSKLGFKRSEGGEKIMKINKRLL